MLLSLRRYAKSKKIRKMAVRKEGFTVLKEEKTRKI